MVHAGSHKVAATRTKRRLFINILEIRRHGGFSRLQIADVQNLTASFPLPIQNDCHVVWSKAGLVRGGKRGGGAGGRPPPRAGSGHRALRR